MSEDPIGFDSADTNFYRYVFNNSTLYTDPQGENPALGAAIGTAILPGAGTVIGAVVGGVAAWYVGDQLANAYSQQKGERGKTKDEHGTDNPYKKYRIDPKDPTKVRYKDPHTGKEIIKKKPDDFDEKCPKKKK